MQPSILCRRKNNCSQIYYTFAEQELYQRYVIVTNHDTALVSGMCILNEGIYCSYSFFVLQCHYFTGALEVIHMSRTPCLFPNTCTNHSYYIKRYVLDSKKCEYVYFRKVIVALLLRCVFIPQN